jgi:hypothetical protein
MPLHLHRKNARVLTSENLCKGARIKQGDKGQIRDIDPKAILTTDFYGYVNLATREWKDGMTLFPLPSPPCPPSLSLCLPLPPSLSLPFLLCPASPSLFLLLHLLAPSSLCFPF